MQHVIAMLRWALIIIFIAFGWLVLSYIAKVLAPVLAALGIAYLLNPVLERLVQVTGLPRDGFRQLFLHAKLDEHHAKELHRVVDTLPLDREQEELIAIAALQTMSSLIDAWLDVVGDGASVRAGSPA